MLYEIMKYLRNFFVREQYTGYFTIADGALQLPLVSGQYILIEDSAMNDGVKRFSVDALNDETFNGCISVLSIPEDFLRLVSEIEAWQTENAGKLNTPYQSESFGGYSYTKAGSSAGDYSWKNAFKSRLDGWRKK